MALNYYHILEVGYDASQDDVKLAYRRLAKMYHPDVNANDAEKEEMFKLVNEAYKVLSDTDRKAAYDLRLLLGVYEEQFSSAENGTSNDYQGNYRQRAYQQKPEPVTYSRKTYIAVSFFLLLVAAAIWVVPLTLSWYSSAYNYKQGVAHYEKGQYFAALNSLDRAIIDFGSKNAEACLLSSKILMSHFGQYSFAVEYANRGLKVAKTNRQKVDLLYTKGLCLKAGANYHLAISQFEEAISLEPQHDSLHYAIANTQAFSLDNYTSAIKSYDALLLVNDAFADAYYERAYSYFMLGDFEKAQADADAYLSLKAEDGKAFLLKGKMALKKGNKQEACTYFDKAFLTHTKGADALKNRYCEL